MSDEVWEYKRGPIEFVSLSDLCFCNSHGQTAVPATGCNCSRHPPDSGHGEEILGRTNQQGASPLGKAGQRSNVRANIFYPAK